MQGFEKDTFDLHCYETLASFDEDYIEQAMPQTSINSKNVRNGLSFSSSAIPDSLVGHGKGLKTHSTNANMNRPKSPAQENHYDFGNSISMLDDNDYKQLLNSEKVHEKDKPCGGNENVHKRESYSLNLLKELRMSHGDYDLNETKGFNQESFISTPKKVCVASQSLSHTCSKFDRSEQLVPQMTSSIEDMDINEPEILIIRDDTLQEYDSGSELDWSSLTPPVPASPSDQRVPESDSEDFICGVGDDCYVPSASSTFFSLGMLDHPGNGWLMNEENIRNVPSSWSSDTDQVVPV